MRQVGPAILAILVCFLILSACSDHNSGDAVSSSSTVLNSDTVSAEPSAHALELAQRYLDAAIRLGTPLRFDAAAIARINGVDGDSLICKTLYPEVITNLVRDNPSDIPITFAEAEVYCPSNVSGLAAIIESTGAMSTDEVNRILAIIDG